MTWLDYAVIGVFAISLALGAWRGLVRELISVLGWVIAFLAANLLAGPLGPSMPQAIPSPELRVAAAFVAVFAGSLIVTHAGRCGQDVKASPGGLIDAGRGTAPRGLLSCWPPPCSRASRGAKPAVLEGFGERAAARPRRRRAENAVPQTLSERLRRLAKSQRSLLDVGILGIVARSPSASALHGLFLGHRGQDAGESYHENKNFHMQKGNAW